MFICNICHYQTDVKRNIDRHFESQKHILKHYTILKEENIEKNIKLQALEEKLQEKDKTIERNEKTIDNMSMHIADLMEMKNQITYMTNTTKNIFKFIEQNSRAQVFAQIEGLNEIMDGYESDEEFAEDMVVKYKNNLFVKCVGDFIAKKYKKDDPLDQSIFNSDVTRNNYKFVESKSCWSDDKMGNKTKNIAIKPVLEFIKEKVLENFTDECRQEIIRRNENVSHELSFHSFSIKLVNSINTGDAEHNILRYLSPHLYMTGKQKQIIESMNEQKLLNAPETPKKRKYVRKQK